MAEGYGFGGEGDWKTAALVRAMKVMGSGLPGGNSFMEDYTYHFEPEQSNGTWVRTCWKYVKALQMENHPAKFIRWVLVEKQILFDLVFNVAGGAALNASIVDMGNRFRLLVNEVDSSST